VKEWPIIFTAPMVRAILEGKKDRVTLPIDLRRVKHPVTAVYYGIYEALRRHGTLALD